MTDAKVTGTVVNKTAAPWSYAIKIPNGKIHWNRCHLIPINGPKSNSDTTRIQVFAQTLTSDTSLRQGEITPDYIVRTLVILCSSKKEDAVLRLLQ